MAGEASRVPHAGAEARPEEACPACGAPAQRGQLVCLECGARMALDYRRPPSWKLALAVIAIVVLAALAGLLIALGAISDGAESEVAAVALPGASPARVASSV